MEVIPFSSYVEDEKVAIAEQFLLPKQLTNHGLSADGLTVTTEAVRRIIREQTREAGVRNLERELATLCRKVARRVAEGNTEPITIDAPQLEDYLGRRKFHWGVMEERDEVGLATGLVWTEVGGDVISIEVSVLPSAKERLNLTGQLGDVMKESAQAALSYIRGRARTLDIPDDLIAHSDIHIHVPAGGVPKDGPSAGITLATTIASALSNRPVRKEIAMTGEITLRGRVLPVGGIKEKMLAAHRAGIREVLLPRENERDLEDIPKNVRDEMTFHLVGHMDEVLPRALMAAQPELVPTT
jgi:ATP-dependent Lon protease